MVLFPLDDTWFHVDIQFLCFNQVLKAMMRTYVNVYDDVKYIKNVIGLWMPANLT